MDDTRDFTPSSIFDPSLWDDNEEFHARMKYEGRTMPFKRKPGTRRKMPALILMVAIIGLLTIGVLSLPL